MEVVCALDMEDVKARPPKKRMIIEKKYDDPLKQAEYAYSLVEADDFDYMTAKLIYFMDNVPAAFDGEFMSKVVKRITVFHSGTAMFELIIYGKELIIVGGSKTVSVIPAKPKQNRTAEANARQKLRVAAYCRVSTDNEEQASSYEVQIEHYTRYIQSNRSGNWPESLLMKALPEQIRKNREFNRMIEECMAGKIDMVITKSISRFARNTSIA